MSRPVLRALGLVTTLALAVPAAATLPAHAASPGTRAQRADAAAPFSLWAPKKVTAYAYKNRTWTDLGLRLIAEGQPFELWSHRASYDDPITTAWRSPSGDVPLPGGAMKDFSGINKFVTLSIVPKKGGDPITMRPKACLNSYAERVRPDAPADSDYPMGCYFNPYSLGSVQGVQEGWASPILTQEHAMHIGAGKYVVTASLAPKYADFFGLTAAESTRTIKLTVTDDGGVEGGDGGGGVAVPSPVPGAAGRRSSHVAQPAAHRPTGAVRRADATGPEPDLRSLPAWGIGLNKKGTQLQFSATVWNAGNSPLVVDGFREHGQDEMDAYQYFFDADGTQTGYQPVGHMHWDPKPSHQHWHFEDFARYTLLNADKSQVAVSHKEAFCLANTDAVDLTVPDAAWQPDNTDLATSCGDLSSLSIREVLAAGWGDTYTQYRAGQAVPVSDLPDGTYYIAVTANPDGNLVEEDTTNNQALRKIKLSTKHGHRVVTVAQVGIIKEQQGYGGTG